MTLTKENDRNFDFDQNDQNIKIFDTIRIVFSKSVSILKTIIKSISDEIKKPAINVAKIGIESAANKIGNVLSDKIKSIGNDKKNNER